MVEQIINDCVAQTPVASVEVDTEKRKRKRLAEERCKRTNTLMKKTMELHAYTGLSVVTIVRDKLGKIIMTGSPDFEKLLLDGNPLVEVGQQSVHKWVDENLSLPKELPEVKSVTSPIVEKLPEQLRYSIPGAAQVVKNLIADFVVEQGSSNVRQLASEGNATTACEKN